jgi:putative two-component system response regulator
MLPPSSIRPGRVCVLGSVAFAREMHDLAPEQFADDLEVVPDVDAALRAVASSAPGTILVDLRSTGPEGLRLVSQLDPAEGPAALLVGGEDEADVMRRALELGAFGSLVTPFGRAQLVSALFAASRLRDRVHDLERRLGDLEHVTERQQAALRSQTEQLRTALKTRMSSEQSALLAQEETVHCLARAIESRDIVTGKHVERMSGYCELVAHELGLHAQAHMIGLAARLHDIGKVAVPDYILLKQSPLTDEERLVMQRHCRTGHEILSDASSDVLRLAAEIALTHHEWYDGSGYPNGLAGERIPVPGRIVAIADSFDALTSDRPYRQALAFDEAREVLRRERGTHFDPVMLDLFLASDQTLEIYRG